MNRIYIILLVLVNLFVIGNTNYRVEYAEESCRINNTVVYDLGAIEHITAVIIKATRHPPYTSGMKCNIKIAARNVRKGHVLLSVRTIDFDQPETCKNYIEIVEEMETHTLCKHYHEPKEGINFSNTSSDFFVFQYHTTTANASYTGFEVVATAYRNGTCGGNFDFRCINRNCISSKLICDGHNNCGDGSDESKDYPSKCGLSRGAIGGITIGVLVLITFVCIGIWWLRNRANLGVYNSHSPQKDISGPSCSPYKQLSSSTVSPTYGTASINY